MKKKGITLPPVLLKEDKSQAKGMENYSQEESMFFDLTVEILVDLTFRDEPEALSPLELAIQKDLGTNPRQETLEGY